MNVDGIVRRVQRLVGDEDEALIEVEDIVDWINEAQDHIARETEILEDRVDFSSEADLGFYSLPDNFIRATRLTYDGNSLTFTSLEEMERTHPNRDADDSSGTPLVAWDWGGKIYLWPIPDRDATDNLSLYYVKTPGTVSAGIDVPQLPARMHNEIVRFCVMRAKELDQDDAKAAEIASSLSVTIGQGKEEKAGPNSSTYPAIRQVDADWEYC